MLSNHVMFKERRCTVRHKRAHIGQKIKKTKMARKPLKSVQEHRPTPLAFMTTLIHEFSHKSHPHTKELSNKGDNKAGHRRRGKQTLPL